MAAAVIPTALMTGLMYRSIDELTRDHLHGNLVNTSENYALAAFNHLVRARTALKHYAQLQAVSLEQRSSIEKLQHPMFVSIQKIGVDGNFQLQTGREGYSLDSLEKLMQARLEDIRGEQSLLLAIPSSDQGSAPAIALAVSHQNSANQITWLIGEINPDYLWGKKNEYPSDIGICVYQGTGKSKTTLFCSTRKANNDNTALEEPENSGSWELFLRAEFFADSWLFVTERLYPADTNAAFFMKGYRFIGAASLSLLVIALLSLLQIRKTMNPLERLMEDTRKISKGEFPEIEVDTKSEFGELARSFNDMSSHIKRQFDTLRALSAVDREIVSRLDVEQLIEQVMTRVHQLKPDAILSLIRLNEKEGSGVQCSIKVPGNTVLTSPRISISANEINVISAYGIGHISHCQKDSHFSHEKFMAGLGATCQWVLPVLWQGEICAFFMVGSEAPLDHNDPDWSEIRELASRIGIAISAEEREEQLLLQAQYDNLTGLPNRILLQDRLRQAMEHSDRTGNPMWVIFLDLDRFKYVNDSMGHHVGDELLVQISGRLQSSVRETDTVARFGGDEFIIILQGPMDDSLRMAILHRLVDAVASPVRVDEHEIITTCSLGIAVYPTDGSTADTLVKHADIAMYRAKDLGRNNFQFFTRSMNEKVAERLTMENHLRKALAQDELYLLYQPKMDLVSGEITGMEALIRWNNKELGNIPPARFIPLAEETGLITQIGEWVIRTACAQAVAWQKAGLGNLLMSVNLSTRQFMQKDLAESIAAILEKTGLEAKYLELELTESLIMSDIDNSLKILHKIKQLGVKLSIDDFGTGYSSLSYLRNLPLDTLKIDKSFTDDIVMHTDQAPIVASIIALARNLKLKVIAEGVESHEQVMYLASHGCNEIQGYYLSRPEPVKFIENMLTQVFADKLPARRKSF